MTHASTRPRSSDCLVIFDCDGVLVDSERLAVEPDLFLYAAKQVGVTPSRCVVVEDSQYGVAGARTAGMKAVGFAGGVTRAAQLSAADVVITDMGDLPGAVGRLLC